MTITRAGITLLVQAFGDGVQSRGRRLTRQRHHYRQLPLRTLIDLADAGARQDVMELVDHQRSPGFGQRRRRRTSEERRDTSKSLGGNEVALGPAVEALGPALACQNSTMILEIELADPGRCRRCGRFRMGTGEIVRRRCKSGLREEREAAQHRLGLDQLCRRAAAAIAIAHRLQHFAGMTLVSVRAARREAGMPDPPGRCRCPQAC